MSSAMDERSGGWGLAEWLSVALGFGVGFMVDWVIIFVSVMVNYDETSDLPFVIPLIAVPVLALSLLAFRRTRVPLLIGIAAGAVVGSGACVGFLRNGIDAG